MTLNIYGWLGLVLFAVALGILLGRLSGQRYQAEVRAAIAEEKASRADYWQKRADFAIDQLAANAGTIHQPIMRDSQPVKGPNEVLQGLSLTLASSPRYQKYASGNDVA